MTTFTVPDTRNVADPNLVITPVDAGVDPADVKDSTSGLQAFVNTTPEGSTILLPFDVVVNGGLIVAGDRILQSAKLNEPSVLHAPVVYPWRVVPDLRAKLAGGAPNPYYNPKGVCAPWLLDVAGSLKNPYGRPETHGAEWGGFDGTTGAAGVDYDGRHLSTRLTAPFKPEHRGLGLRGVISPSEGFSVAISSVDADGKTVRFNDPSGVVRHESSTHTLAWAVSPKLGWSTVFMPNPTWKPYYVGNANWYNYETALRRATDNNRGRAVLRVRDTSAAIGIEVVGANPAWQQAIINYDASRPVVNEFQHAILVEDPRAVAFLCYAHHSHGDGISGPGIVWGCVVRNVGRQGMVVHYDGKQIVDCVIEMTRRAAVDFETGRPVHGVRISNLTIGGNNGISISAQLIDCVLDRIHSTNADIAAGRIARLAPLMRGKVHCAPGSRNVTYSNHEYDLPQDNMLVAHYVDGLHVFGCRVPIRPHVHASDGYVVKPWANDNAGDRCTTIDVHDNDGGPACLGQVAP